ncbi:MAG: zinc-dependent alcohol dehydrogenase family protein [Bacteroidetes bacterium]|nr:zinc-dependent alcohol dehydrogenase family protein [Bacteroidota bacterium]
MSKIVRLHKFGSTDHLKIDEVPSQELKKGEVRLKIDTASISRDNSMLINADKFADYGFPVPQLPTKLGYEASGTVTEVGEGVNPSWIGKKVAPAFGLDEIKYGMLGEEAVIPASFLIEYPQNLTPEQATAFWVPFLTAYGGLTFASTIKKGDFVAITAATSSVGLAAIQIVNDLGGVPIAVIRTSGKKEKLLQLGAAHVIATREENYVERIAEITSQKGVSVTFNPIGGSLLDQLVIGASNFGTIVQYGILASEAAVLSLPQIISKELTFRGYTVGAMMSDKNRAEEAQNYILERLANGKFTPKVAKVFPLEKIHEAYAYLDANEEMGRIVIAML